MRKQPVVNKTKQGGMGLYAKNEAPTVKPTKPAPKKK
jgi:hypothetical protein